jgi:hypothetical protein
MIGSVMEIRMLCDEFDAAESLSTRYSIEASSVKPIHRCDSKTPLDKMD